MSRNRKPNKRYSLLIAWNRLKNVVPLQYEREPTEGKIRKNAGVIFGKKHLKTVGRLLEILKMIIF